MSTPPEPLVVDADDPTVRRVSRPRAAAPEPSPTPPLAIAAAAAAPAWRGRALSLFLGAALSLFLLWASVQISDFVLGLFARNTVLGWIGAGLLAVIVGLGLAMAGRELVALRRLRSVERVRARAETAIARNDPAAARAVAAEIAAMTAAGAGGAGEWARARHAERAGDVVDADDVLGLAETDLLAGPDAAAEAAIRRAARNVALTTAVSPFALVDAAVALHGSAKVVREIAAAYGGRPGRLASLRLARQAIGYLVVTGGLAVGDDALGQILGHGLAAKLSARLGQGLINGMLAARIGLAAMTLCRPLAFKARPRPSLSSIMTGIASELRPKSL